MCLRLSMLALIGSVWFTELPAQNRDLLPIQKVVLYKNGMGYFQHQGATGEDEPVEIPLTSSQLDDVLKSLTVLDLDGGQIAGVTYDSNAPLERRMSELAIDLRSVGNLVQLLNQIRGTKVSVRAPTGLVQGRLLGAEPKAVLLDGRTVGESVEVTVLTPTGELRIVELQSAGGIQLGDSSLAGDMSRYLELLDSENSRDVRRLKIQTSSPGSRRLFVSYTSEAPIWKSTYRIILEPNRKPLLQGWALVDNTTPLDWNSVELSLVAGAPVSFIHELSQPIYGQRPIVPVRGGVQVRPQLHEGTLDEPAESLAASGAGISSRGNKRLVATEPMPFERARMETAASAPPARSLGDAARQAVPETAIGQRSAEQFEYRIQRPVTIARNRSALLPILQSEINAEKVVLYNPTWADGRPRFAVWLTNTSALTLDGGAFTVIDANSFAGEGLLETIQPNERRLLSYAVDLAAEINTDRESEQSRVERIVINRGLLVLHRKVVDKRTYIIRNRSEQRQTFLIEHPVRPGWTLTDTPDPVESSSESYRFQVRVDGGSTERFRVSEQMPQQSQYQVANVTPDQVAIWVRERSLDAETERALRGIVGKKNEIAEVTQQLNLLRGEQDSIFQDQSRVRDNLNRLGRTPEEAQLCQRYIQQMESQEDRLAQLRSEQERLQGTLNQAQRELGEMIDRLSLDRRTG